MRSISQAPALALLCCAVALAGCTAWRLAPDRLDTPVPNREPVEIWSRERSVVVHGVQLHGDTVRAVPRWRAPECDTCAIFFRLSAIDSVRSRRYSAGRTIGLVGGAAAVLVLYGLSQIEFGLPPGPQ